MQDSSDDQVPPQPDEGRLQPLDPSVWMAWYRSYAHRLKAFLLSVLRNEHQAEEALQATFAKALTHGGDVELGREQAWLFQVGFNEALGIRRRLELGQRVREKLADSLSSDSGPAPDVELLSWETVQQVRTAMSQLPYEQQIIVQRRIYDEHTFQHIADDLKLPLGTVLTRMRMALKRLKTILQEDFPESH